jgi:hypothetical protein
MKPEPHQNFRPEPERQLELEQKPVKNDANQQGCYQVLT